VPDPTPIQSDVLSLDASSDWQRSLREAIRTSAELLEVLDLDPDTVAGFQPATDQFPLLVPRSFAARMRKGDPDDPLLRQVLPDPREQLEVAGFRRNPLAEDDLAQQGVLHKYAGRALLVTTGACPVHCRYCFRRHFPYALQLASKDQWRPALEELARHPGLTEVILSGGDPLSLSDRRLADLIAGIEQLESVHTVRIHTRFPIILPERVDHRLLDVLSETRLHTVMVVHCNHANEIDTSVRAALQALKSTDTLLLNQSVLLRDINDNVQALEELSHALFKSGVLPYYLHLLDPVAGAAHFDVPESRGRALIAELRSQLPGYLVPRLAREEPGQSSKTILL
jgi:EF-P beta-lysylation protein EpmB